MRTTPVDRRDIAHRPWLTYEEGASVYIDGGNLRLSRGDCVSANAKPRPIRKARIDAERNRERLLEAAKTVFAEKAASASLEEIARAAVLGIGTLYRHFPTRDALIEAVYRHELEQLALAANTFSAKHPPIVALREWLLVFVDYLDAKYGMASVLNLLVSGTSALYAESGVQMKQAIEKLTDNAVASGDIRMDMEPLDLLRALAGVMNREPGLDSKRAAKRLVDILIAGIRSGIR
jgi:AcrR family transcriptional regulator